nr:hypothetical protein [Tanacetum cinerariifolium]
ERGIPGGALREPAQNAGYHPRPARHDALDSGRFPRHAPPAPGVPKWLQPQGLDFEHGAEEKGVLRVAGVLSPAGGQVRREMSQHFNR